MKIKALFFLIIGLTALRAEEWKNSLPGLTEEEVKTLEAGDFLIDRGVVYTKGLNWFPENSPLKEEFFKDLKKYNPERCVEMLYLIDTPETEELGVYLLNNLRAVSGQAGIEYFSDRRKKMHPLIDESYFINNLKDEYAMKDPVVDSLPSYEKRFLYQDDTTFGGNNYSYITRSKDNNIWVQIENTDVLEVLVFIDAVEKEGVRVNFYVQPQGDKILIHALAQIREMPEKDSVMGFPINIPDSFRKRMDSVMRWYIKRLKANQ